MGTVGSLPLDTDPSAAIAKLSDKLHLASIKVHPSSILFELNQNHATVYSDTHPLLLLPPPSGQPSFVRRAPLPCLEANGGLNITFKLRVPPTLTGDKQTLNRLTFVCARDEKETSEILGARFRIDPNIHQQQNVHLIGDLTSADDEYKWTWSWTPPPGSPETLQLEPKLLGWRFQGSFVEYSAEENGFRVLTTFAFCVTNSERQPPVIHTSTRQDSFSSIGADEGQYAGYRHRRTSSSSSMNSLSPTSLNAGRFFQNPAAKSETMEPSPLTAAGTFPPSPTFPSVDASQQSTPFEVMVDDGPLFRAMILSYEKRTQTFKMGLKKVLKGVNHVLECRRVLRTAESSLMDALHGFPTAEPILSAYFDAAAAKLDASHEVLLHQLEVLVADPLRRLYEIDVKVAETKKKEFEGESETFYKFLSKYLSMKNVDGARPEKVKKKMDIDAKYVLKKQSFELTRFDYSTYLSELHGGAKDQEIIYHLANYCEKCFAFYHTAATGLSELRPNLDQLRNKMAAKSKEYHSQKKDQREKRKVLETRTSSFVDGPFAGEDTLDSAPLKGGPDSLGIFPLEGGGNDAATGNVTGAFNKFRGFRDLDQATSNMSAAGRRKEGFLFATSRPKSHAGHVGGAEKTSKLYWHKYWCVLSGGTLREYINWKGQVESHNEPIDLKFTTCREARNSERRFCFEIITPVYTRIYQATCAEEMDSWIAVINNAIEGVLNGTKSVVGLSGIVKADKETPINWAPNGMPVRRRSTSFLPELKAGSSFLSMLRADPSNHVCADCGAPGPDWCVINFGALVCIECSGIHRSLGTHISKVRSLNLDTTTFTGDLLHLLRHIGNATSNAIWEARVSNFEDNSTSSSSVSSTPVDTSPSVASLPRKPGKTDSREAKARFITAKYADRAFVDRSLLEGDMIQIESPVVPVQTTEAALPLPIPQRRPTATDLLWGAIVKEDVVEAIRAISLGADVNSRSSPPPLSVKNIIPAQCTTPLHLALLLPTHEPRPPSISSSNEEEGDELTIFPPSLSAAPTMMRPPIYHSLQSNAEIADAAGDSPMSSRPPKLNIGESTSGLVPSPKPPTSANVPSTPSPPSAASASLEPRHLPPRSNFPMAELLLQNGADPLIMTDPATGFTVLHAVAQAEDSDAVYYLLGKQIDRSSVPDARGRTPEQLGCGEVFSTFREWEREKQELRFMKEKSASAVNYAEEKTHAAVEALAAVGLGSPPRRSRKFFGQS